MNCQDSLNTGSHRFVLEHDFLSFGHAFCVQFGAFQLGFYHVLNIDENPMVGLEQWSVGFQRLQWKLERELICSRGELKSNTDLEGEQRTLISRCIKRSDFVAVVPDERR